MKSKRLCLRCQNLTINPISQKISCSLGRKIVEISDPNLCRYYSPLKREKINKNTNSQADLFKLNLVELSPKDLFFLLYHFQKHMRKSLKGDTT